VYAGGVPTTAVRETGAAATEDLRTTAKSPNMAPTHLCHSQPRVRHVQHRPDVDYPKLQQVARRPRVHAGHRWQDELQGRGPKTKLQRGRTAVVVHRGVVRAGRGLHHEKGQGAVHTNSGQAGTHTCAHETGTVESIDMSKAIPKRGKAW
jgi:hypothetical protein